MEFGQQISQLSYRPHMCCVRVEDIQEPSVLFNGSPQAAHPPESPAARRPVAQLAQERLIQAIRGVACAESALRWTLDYLSQREMFGHTQADFQKTRFELADMHASTLMQRVFVDRCVELHLREELDATDAAAAKLVATNLQCQVLDRCLQRFGDWGYRWEYQITRAFAEARMSRIGGGATEVMKQIIANSLLPKMPRGGKSK